jgi:transcriptional regulator GlxA family with amidase domain
MKHLTILVPDGSSNNLSSIVGTYKIISRANEYWQQRGNAPVFQIQLAGLKKEVELHEGLFTVKPHTDIAKIDRTDLIIIPSLNHAYKQAAALNRPMVDWIGQQYKMGAEIASICTGAFLLAATGLLDGKSCSTHWTAVNDFNLMYPKVQLKADQLITDENGIYTNGGAYSFLNLIIYLVEKYFDRATAIYCAKVFQIEMDRNAQSVFAIFTGQKQHDDPVIQQAQEYIEQHVTDKISFEKLAASLHVGRRNFDRRFLRATGNTPLAYLQRVKIEAAKKTLESNRKTIHEVMYELGYADIKAFRELFRKITGMSPLAYKDRYAKQPAF